MHSRRLAIGLVAFALVTSGAALLLLGPAAAPARAAGPPDSAAASVGLTIDPSEPSPVSPAFWGIDMRPYVAADSAHATAFTETPLDYVVWPGGAIADRYNVTTNVITNDDGSTYVPPSSEAQFIGWCERIRCQAILQVPGEIDSPSTAAYYVAYTEQTLGFHPAYWEIGNEPVLWQHFGIPWSRWSTSQDQNATPVVYAEVVHAYISAMRAIDPGIRIIGLPGLGSGSAGEPGWIRATVSLNGPELSAVAIHVYPAGGGQSDPTLSAFYASLVGRGSLAVRIPQDRAVIAAACSGCADLPIFVTEMGSGNEGGGYESIMSSFADVPFVSTEILQALALGVANVDLFAFEATYPGSLFIGSTTPTAIGTLYEEVFPYLGSETLPTSLSGSATGVFAQALLDPSHRTEQLFLVNTNLDSDAAVSLSGTGLAGLANSLARTWGPSDPAPVTTAYPVGLPADWTLPAQSIAVLTTPVAGASDPSDYAVSGVIQARSTGAPVSGATITATGAVSTVSTLSASDGSFALSLPNGSYALAVASAGYDPASETFTVNGGPVAGLTVGLSSSTVLLYVVSGTVTDATTGLGVGGASVTLASPDVTVSNLTGADGAFSLEAPAGTYSMIGRVAGYAPASTTLAVSSSGVNGISIPLMPLTGAKYAVTGTVVTLGTGASVVGAHVDFDSVLFNASAASSTGGSFSVLLPNGTYAVWVNATGYVGSHAQVVVRGSSVGPLELGVISTGPALYPVRGTVAGASSATPVDAVVEVSGGAYGEVVDADASGSFEADLPNGTYSLTATANGFVASSRSVVVAGVGVSGVDFRLNVGSGPGSGAGTARAPGLLTGAPVPPGPLLGIAAAGAVVGLAGMAATQVRAKDAGRRRRSGARATRPRARPSDPAIPRDFRTSPRVLHGLRPSVHASSRATSPPPRSLYGARR